MSWLKPQGNKEQRALPLPFPLPSLCSHDPHSPPSFVFPPIWEHATMWVQQLPGPRKTTWALKGLSFNMKRELWKLAFVLVLLKTTLDVFHGRTDGDRTLKTQEGNSFDSVSQRNLATLQPPLPGSVKCFSLDPVEEPNFNGQQICFQSPVVAVTGTRGEI